MATLTAEEKIELLLTIMATAPDFKPDFAMAAKELGASAAGTVKARLKSIVDADKNFALRSTRGCQSVTTLVRVSANDKHGAITPPKTASAKKRNKKADDDQVDDSPTKYRKMNAETKVDSDEEITKAEESTELD